MTPPVVLPVWCPICNAAPGEPCEIVVNEWIRARRMPHLYRFVVAREEASSK